MAKQQPKGSNIRKLTKIGGKSIGLTLPIEMVRGLGWKEKQKIVVKRVKRGLLINDWKRR